MNTLHLLNESPFANNTFAQALTFLSPHDGILLTGDAVYALQVKTSFLETQALPISIYALSEDVTARSVTIALDNVTIIDYPQFIKICTEYKKVVSWL